MHLYRHVFSHVPATNVREVSHMLKAIHAEENRDAADFNLAAARLRYIAGSAWSTKRNMSTRRLLASEIAMPS